MRFYLDAINRKRLKKKSMTSFKRFYVFQKKMILSFVKIVILAYLLMLDHILIFWK